MYSWNNSNKIIKIIKNDLNAKNNNKYLDAIKFCIFDSKFVYVFDTDLSKNLDE